MSKDKSALLQGTLDMLILKALERDAMHGFGLSLRLRELSHPLGDCDGRSPSLPRVAAAFRVKACAAIYNPRDTTLVILANSMVAARLGDLRPGVINARLVTRELYLFSTDPDVLCRQTSRLRVGYVRGTARRAEIVNTLAHENPRRVVSAIEATDFPVPGDMANLLGTNGSLEIAALVADDLGGSYDAFKEQVLDRRPGAIKPVARCTAAGDQGPPRLEKTLDGSVSYLTIATPPAAPGPAPLVALLRPGQEPGVAPEKTWFVRWTESLFPTVQTADSEVRASDFKDFPVVLAQHGPLLTADLLASAGRPLGGYLTASFAEIARAETVEQP